MQQQRMKWRADHGSRAVKAMGAIQDSIEALNDEDLLDLHDIFRDQDHSPIAELAAAEMQKRDIRP